MTAYMRSVVEPLDYDFANLDHNEWCNIYDRSQTSREDFFEIFDRAEAATFEMAALFMSIRETQLSTERLTSTTINLLTAMAVRFS